MSERMSLVVFSGTADKLTAVATLATGAAAMEMDVQLDRRLFQDAAPPHLIRRKRQ